MDNAAEESPTVRIINLGRLSDKTWPGKVSAQQVAINFDTLHDYYVESRPETRTRCIDGRHDPRLDESNLGAQVPGGAPGAALAYRLGVDRDDLTRGTFVKDAESMIESYLRLGLAPGGHRDDSSVNGVGCGAIDGIVQALECMIDPELVDDHKRLTRTLLDTMFDRDHYLRVLGAGLVLKSRASDYFAAHQTIIDLLEQKSPGSISVLEGAHRESLVIVNLVPNTTMSSNRFSDEHDGLQAFGYDLWRSKQLAETLFPLPSQDVERQRFVTARVMITVATLMALTDGSQQLLIRVPEER